MLDFDSRSKSTVADWWQITDRPRNALWLRSGDADRFYDLLADRIARLP